MKLKQNSYMHSNCSGIVISIFLAVLLAFIGTGCQSVKEVKKIVEKSNATVLNAIATQNLNSMPGIVLPDADGKRAMEAWEEPAAKIDAYIAAHPEEKKTASALRIRQAILYLSYKQYELAKAAFNQTSEGDLTSDRDKALKALQSQLLWWFQLDESRAPDFVKAGEHVKKISDRIKILNVDPENESIRDYLAEMRAWIEIHMAKKAPNVNFKAKYITDAIDNYASVLKKKDITAINEEKPSKGLGPLSLQVRRQIRAMTVIKEAGSIVIEVRQEIPPGTVKFKTVNAKSIIALNQP